MMEIPRDGHLLIPLPLAELLFVTLGPLADILEDEEHRWVPVVKMVLRAYRDGRDDMVMKLYGKSMIPEIDMITVSVSEQLSQWVEDMAIEEGHFEKWKEELDGNA